LPSRDPAAKPASGAPVGKARRDTILDLSLLWIPATLAAAAAQTARNAMQHRLTEVLGTVGATQVRFLYGFPFALLFLAAMTTAGGLGPPAPTPRFFGFVLGGAVTQILATALMLAAMRTRSFAVTIAYTKTEPVQVALVGLLVLGDELTALGMLAVVAASAGVILMSWPSRTKRAGLSARELLTPALMGVASGGVFALSAVAYRGAILALPEGAFFLRATTTLTWGLGLQTVMLLVWLTLMDRAALLNSLRIWRSSLFAGLMGAVASQFWFLGFSLTAAANVRTLGLAEVVFAVAVSRRLFAQAVSRREIAGLLLIVAGVLLLLVAAA
jgi:drug/metabolite transporter (DMT)-like permease